MYHNVTSTPGHASRQLHDANRSLKPSVRSLEVARPGAPSAGMRPPLPPGDESIRQSEGLINKNYSIPNHRVVKLKSYQDRESAIGAQVVVEAAAPGANPYGTIAGDQGLSFSDVLRKATKAPPSGRQQVISSVNTTVTSDLTTTPFVS